MFFYVDESGNTGNNLFDANQPFLYYGFLGCQKNLDIVAEPTLKKLRSELGVNRLHANELGERRLIPVAEAFIKFQKRNDVRFNFYSVSKRDHAVISFFDQVFDSGINDAVSRNHYWTPMRYVLILKVAHLFDEGLCRGAWDARLMQSRERCAEALIEICQEVRKRVSVIPDRRSQEIIDGALLWATHNPESINYGISNRESGLQISPNLVGFQQVLQGIASRTSDMGRPARSIIVDQQNEFNTAQQFLSDIYRRLRVAEKIALPAGMHEFDWSQMPEIDLEFRAGDESAGLEMVDVYVWIMKRIEEGRELPNALLRLIHGQRHRGKRDEVSLAGIERRWAFLLDLPEPTPEAAEVAQRRINEAEKRRIEALTKLGV
tara:strand:- start:472 stop:1602 length:1131 start_codon:yes stop_codon:yes gene_type:complete